MPTGLPHEGPRPPHPRPSGSAGLWCAVGGGVVGLVYAAVSAYWAAGGTLGLDTVGGELEQLSRKREAGMVTVLWLTVALKVVAALLGPAVVYPGRGTRQQGALRPLLWLVGAASWLGTVLLIGYGGLLVIGQSVVLLSGNAPSAEAFRWHLFLWDPWFLVWGLLLGVATWHGTRRCRKAPLPSSPPNV